MTGPQGIGETIFVQTIVNDSIELETIATPTNNNVEDYNIADEHRCCPSQERDGQLEEVVVLTSFIGQLYQSFVWMFIYSVFNICRHMNELLIMGLLLWRFFIMLFSYTLAIKPPYICVCKMVTVLCMETTIPFAGCDILFTRSISAST